MSFNSELLAKMDPIDTMQADPKHPEAKRSPSTWNTANHENSQVASEPQSSSLYSMDTRTARAAPINFLAEPEDDEVSPSPSPSQHATSTVKRSAARANFEKKVAYPLRPTRTQFKPAATSSERAPRAASNSGISIVETETPNQEDVLTSPSPVQQRLFTLFQECQGTTGAGGHKPAGLLTIPPEIRNQIYDLVAAPEVGAVSLLTARPPTKVLPLLCRQIYGEVRLLHKAAHRSYWRDTQFIIRPETQTREIKCNPADVANIRHIYFEVKLRWLIPELRRREGARTAVYERWADGKWYELKLDDYLSSYENGSCSWCILPVYPKGSQSFYTKLPTMTDVHWREITIEELSVMLFCRYD
ncbi:hypothetical protein LTR17_002182 [Elasticomyces elasticus]|nr:hypothetical protein LTR17_002182 [Elasticomyces elasticus]